VWGDIPDPDPHFGVWLGDFLHNVRCALDYCVYSAVVEVGKDSGENAKFPIKKTKDLWLSDLVNRPPKARPSPLIGLAFDSREFAIVEQAQPYHVLTKDRPGHPLLKLQGLSNIDKHRQLHAVATRTTTPTFRVEPEGVVRLGHFELAPRHTQVKSGTEIASFQRIPIPGAAPGSEVKVWMEGLIHLAYGPRGKRPIAEGDDLERIYSCAVQIVDAFGSI
jgi:hypothetical protein